MAAINLQCIERNYGDHELDVRDRVHEELVVALPVILSHFQQNLHEWCKSHA